MYWSIRSPLPSASQIARSEHFLGRHSVRAVHEPKKRDVGVLGHRLVPRELKIAEVPCWKAPRDPTDRLAHRGEAAGTAVRDLAVWPHS
jgi:hypothetical protein